MNRREFISTASCLAAPAAKGRPNVLFLMTDEQHHRSLSMHREPVHQDAQHGPHRARGRAVHQRHVRDAVLLAFAGDHDYRRLSSPARHCAERGRAQQAGAARAGRVPEYRDDAPPPGVRHRFPRQMAPGRTRRVPVLRAVRLRVEDAPRLRGVSGRAAAGGAVRGGQGPRALSWQAGGKDPGHPQRVGAVSEGDLGPRVYRYHRPHGDPAGTAAGNADHQPGGGADREEPESQFHDHGIVVAAARSVGDSGAVLLDGGPEASEAGGQQEPGGVGRARAKQTARRSGGGGGRHASTPPSITAW